MMVAALYVDPQSGPYAPLLGEAMCWGVERDAKLYAGPWPVVAHPPCGPWSRLSHLCKHQDPTCGPRAVEQVREFGGVLEHPAHSKLWAHCGLPLPGASLSMFGARDEFTLEVEQCRWGHKCIKRTWLFFSGVELANAPVIPPWAEPTHCIDDGAARRDGRPSKYKRLPHKEAHLTPVPFAEALVRAAATATPRMSR